jgi:hypothetical protein
MVTVSITLRLKRYLWYLVRCGVARSEDENCVFLHALSPRTFLSQEAAVTYVTRRVLTYLREQRGDVADEMHRPVT